MLISLLSLSADHCDGLVTSNSTLSGNCSAALLSTAHTAGRRQLSAGGGGASPGTQTQDTSPGVLYELVS